MILSSFFFSHRALSIGIGRDGIGCDGDSTNRHTHTCAFNVLGKVAAVISISDQVKSEAALAVWALHKMGIHSVLLTGDNAKTAEAAAKQVGIREVFAEVLPNQKMDKIKQLQVKLYRVGL